MLLRFQLTIDNNSKEIGTNNDKNRTISDKKCHLWFESVT